MATPSGSARKGGSEWGHKAAGLAAEGGRLLVRIQSLGPRNGSSFWDGPFLLYTARPETYYRVGSLGGLFAAPFVTGAVAAMKSLRPGADIAVLQELLAANATDRGLDGYDPYYGNGILHLGRCLNVLTGEEGVRLSPPGTGETQAFVRNGTGAGLEAWLIGVSADRWGGQRVEFTVPLSPGPWQWLRVEVPEGDWKLFLVSREDGIPLCAALFAAQVRQNE